MCMNVDKEIDTYWATNLVTFRGWKERPVQEMIKRVSPVKTSMNRVLLLKLKIIY